MNRIRMLSTHTIQDLIGLAQVAHHSGQEEADWRSADSPMHSLESLQPSPPFQKLHDALERLSRGQMAEVMALVWLGRGAAGETPEDWADLVAKASQELEGAAGYLAGHARLADYLQAGLAKLDGRETHD